MASKKFLYKVLIVMIVVLLATLNFIFFITIMGGVIIGAIAKALYVHISKLRKRKKRIK